MSKKAKRVVSMLMMAILLLTQTNITSVTATTVDSYSDPTSPNPNQRPAKWGYYGRKGPSVLLTLSLVDNTSTSSDREKIRSQPTDSLEFYSESGLSIIDQYLYQYPTFMLTSSEIGNACLIYRPEYNRNITAHRVMDTSFTAVKPAMSYQSVSGGTHKTSIVPDVIGSEIKGDAADLEAFKQKTLTLKRVKNLVSANASAVQAKANEFLKGFSNSEDISKMLNSIFTKSIDPDVILQNQLNYLDMLIVINYMTGSKHWNVIDNYLKTLNATDEQSKFSVVFMVSLWPTTIKGKESENVYFAPNIWYSYTSNEPISKFTGITGKDTAPTYFEQKASDEGYYGSNQKAYLKKAYDKYESAIAKRAASVDTYFTTQWNRGDALWTSDCVPGTTNWGTVKMLMPTNFYGKPTGAFGYTYFSDAGYSKTISTAVNFEEHIEVSSEQAIVQSGDTVSASIKINLVTPDANINEVKTAYESYKAKGIKPTLTLTLGMECLSGSGTSASTFDRLIKPVAGATLRGNKVTISDMEWKDLKAYLKGEKDFELADSDIAITEDTKNKYTLKATITFGDKEYKARQNGKKNETDMLTVSDSVSWTLAPEPEYNKATFYSEMEEPYVEIKEGTPGHESFEAMAGVPTTEDLYVGFGATEFMLNMELEQKKTAGNDSRLYTMKYTDTNCSETNDKCTYTCPGHTPGGCGKVITPATETTPAKVCSKSTTWNCTGGEGQAVCECGAKTTTYKPTRGEGTSSRCISKKDGSYCDTGKGCQHVQKTNECHTHSHTYTATITQPVDDFCYIDITALELWQVNELRLEGNSDLFRNPLQKINPGTGYRAFYSQEQYRNNNGRLRFSFVFKPDAGNAKEGTVTQQAAGASNRWGNTEVTAQDTKVRLKTEVDEAATAYFNAWLDVMNAQGVQADVISDYCVLETTEGFQSAMFHTYKSDKVSITGTFTTGSESKSLTSDPLTFSTEPAWEEFYEANSYAAGSWDPKTITRSGYNGKYASPSIKWSNGNRELITSGFSQFLELGAQPNIASNRASEYYSKTTNFGFLGDGFANLRMTGLGLDVWDSTDTVTKGWSASDSIDPVTNGEYDTGNCFLKADKVIEFNDPGGVDYGDEHADKSYQQEVGYTAGQDKVNNIVIHNPTSTQYAVVVSNNERYDLRTDDKTLTDNNPSPLEVCPLDESCQYQTLICQDHIGSLHSAGCYAQVQSGTEHRTGLNTHVCDDSCWSEEKVWIPAKAELTGTNHINSGGGKTQVAQFTVTEDTVVTFESTSYGPDPVGHIIADTTYRDDDSGPSYNFRLSNIRIPAGTNVGFYISPYNSNSSGSCTWKITVHSGSLGDIGTGEGHWETKSQPHTVSSSSLSWDTYEYVAARDMDVSYSYSSGHVGVFNIAEVDGSGSVTKWLAQYSNNSASSRTGTVHLQEGRRYHFSVQAHDGCSLNTTLTFTLPAIAYNCTHKLNKHDCVLAGCTTGTKTVLVCEDPHHHQAGEPWDYSAASSHYTYGDPRCWKPCGDNSKHVRSGVVVAPGGTVYDPGKTFINLDRSFTIYFPDIGDFAQQPSLHGIAACTGTRGMGYVDGMNVYKWTRNKLLTFPVDVIWYSADGTPHSYSAGSTVDITGMPSDAGKPNHYTFYCTLGNHEAADARMQFNSIATNALETDFYCDNTDNRNLSRDVGNLNAAHTSQKIQLIDIVGYIGSLTINDTGDFRFSELFKQTRTDGTWLIPNIVRTVYYNIPNKIASDTTDVRQEAASAATKWHSAYGVTEDKRQNVYGGKEAEYVKLPLTAADNPNVALQGQQLRPGYQLYMDLETVGDYYGETRDTASKLQDSQLNYKIQILPRYWELNLDTGVWTPVDVYMGDGANYRPVVLFSNFEDSSEWSYYVDWVEESARRNYTQLEGETSYEVKEIFSPRAVSGEVGASVFPDAIRLPAGTDYIGAAKALFLNDLNRTFIGSEYTYGTNRNPYGFFDKDMYKRQSQRWHFTVGLPSSSVFIRYNGVTHSPCTDENIKAVQESNSVIVCALDIKAAGEVWTLEYDGSGINRSDGGGFQVEVGGRKYGVPTDPGVTPNDKDKGKPLTDPIVAIYSNKFTSKDDLNTEGSH